MKEMNNAMYAEDARIGAKIRKIVDSGKNAEVKKNKDGGIVIYRVVKHNTQRPGQVPGWPDLNHHPAIRKHGRCGSALRAARRLCAAFGRSFCRNLSRKLQAE